MANLTQAGIVFGNGQVLTKDPMRSMTEYLGISNRSLNANNYVWSAYLAGRNGRGTFYNDSHSAVVGNDGYGSYIAGYNNAGYNRIEVTNYTDSNMRVNIVGGIISETDDYWQYLVYRDGSPSSISNHVGGAQVINSGQQLAYSGVHTTTIQQDIAANSTTAFWLYATVFNGSGSDALRSVLSSTFNSWI